ncbi:ATPase, T2SS/T4P/T4SS family [Pseudoalteromonas carrageenovora]|uniref:CpaF family protein n=1 Tax=Pseudoalteromonas TaxID=53246 RepID=UPI0007320D43|nr:MULTISPECIES: ATPase, T2SS/T4P/T4SS family [Pseudoalteromonas]KTF09431.1 type IV secretion system protein VirB11 [Pseudoalteromonas sp. H103]MDO6636072.1 ATPase, T2SS/T4P/T4SS family [Pseudoalteromonas carrageenovora]MDO6646909.1 ATPase, T2SS/T4P/T4SS family [Pseudoalteromonas carrageenovora]
MFNLSSKHEEVQTNLSTFEELKKLLHDAVIEEYEQEPTALLSDNILEKISALCVELPQFSNSSFNQHQQAQVVQAVYDEIQGLGPIAQFMLDDQVSDILINDTQDIWIDKQGKLLCTASKFDDERHLRRFVDRLLDGCGRQVNALMPIVDGKLKDGSRVHIIVPPACTSAAIVSIRKFNHKKINDEFLVANQFLDKNVLTFLQTAVKSGVNILVCGNAGAGKTSLLNVLANSINKNERVVTIEESAELNLHHNHVVQLEAHDTNSDGKGAVSLRDLVKAALRMRADRILVGEVRSGEVIDMLQAMNCGHQGSMTTIHANSASDAVTRLSTLVQLHNAQLSDAHTNALIASSIQLIVHVSRSTDGVRTLKSIGEIKRVNGAAHFCPLYSKPGFEPIENNFVQDSSVISFMQSQGENAQTLQALLKSKAEADYD